MANEDLGIKRDCPECGARFYDLNKDPALCPKCAHEFVPEVILKPRRTRKEEEAENQTEESNEDEAEDEAAPNEAETSLDEADNQDKTATGARKASLDEEDDDGDDDDDNEDIPDIDGLDVDVDIDTENDDTLLADEDDEDDMGVGGYIKPASGTTSDDA